MLLGITKYCKKFQISSLNQSEGKLVLQNKNCRSFILVTKEV